MEIEQLPEPVVDRRPACRGVHPFGDPSGVPPAAPAAALLDAAQLAVVAGPRAPPAGDTGEPRAHRDADTGPAVVQETGAAARRRPEQADRPLAAARRRRRRHVRLSRGAAGHVPGRVQDAAERADQDAAHVRHAQAVQRVAGLVRVGPGPRAAAGVRFVRGSLIVRPDHPEVHTEEQEPSDVRLPVGRRPA